MYKEIYRLINNDLQNYDKRSLTRKSISKSELSTIYSYTSLWASDESNKDLALALSHDLDQKLYKQVKMVVDYWPEVKLFDNFINKLNYLAGIDEALSHEESTNMGLSKEARRLRKIWRKELKSCHKWLKVSCKNHLAWLKEHRKPKQEYVLKSTYEIHNGLYYTIRAIITQPYCIKSGFKKL